jgi:xanthine dehydrogenase large subunit
MEAFAVREALRAAVGAFGPAGSPVDLGSPATPEAVYWAVERAREASIATNGTAASTSPAELAGV